MVNVSVIGPGRIVANPDIAPVLGWLPDGRLLDRDREFSALNDSMST